MRVLITATGGHFTAALSVIEELAKIRGCKIFWVGSAYALETDPQAPTFESLMLPKLGIPFWAIKTGKLQRGRMLQTLNSLVRLPVGFLQSLAILARVRPNVVLSFGGYVSLPVCFAAWLLHIPILVHEQTTTSGLANRIVSRIAAKVAISHPSSAKDFPKEKVVLTGNPVRKGVWEAARYRLVPGVTPNVIYITGGSRGSRLLNNVVFEILPELVKLGQVFHQTGMLDFEKAKAFARKFKNSYHPAVAFSPSEVEQIYKKASLVIARSGANTVSELEATGIPAILIPIPWVEKNEQQKNAQILASSGQAKIIDQERLSASILLETAKKILACPELFFRRRRRFLLARPDSAVKIVELVKSLA